MAQKGAIIFEPMIRRFCAARPELKAGALIYLAGEKKTRFCLPNTRFLLHQPMGGARGPATDIEIEIG
jgi:hypothetical protein